MNKWEKKHTIFSFAIVILLGLTAYLSFTYPTFEKVKSFQLLKINPNGTFAAEAIIEVKCDNWFSFTGREIEFNMYYGDSLVSTGKIEKEISFKKNTIVELPMNCNFRPSVFGNDLETLLFKDTVTFNAEIKGKFTLLNVSSSKDMEVKMPMSELAGSIVSAAMSDKSIDVDSLTIESVSLTKTKIGNVFVFENSMSIDYTVKTIEFSVFADEELENEISTGNYEVNQLIKSGDSAFAKGSIVIDNISSLRSGFDKLRKRELIYYLSGIAFIEIGGHQIQVPVEQKFLFNPLNQKIEIIK
ncbi:hypothetical protein N8017_05080 [Crocinitomicaceae bacterium]|nr:hypothetical protein [Crocinitomicaceae bacterium]